MSSTLSLFFIILLASFSSSSGVSTTDLRPVFLIPTFSNSHEIIRFANMLLNESPDITDGPLIDCALTGCEPQFQFLLSKSNSFGVIYVPMIHNNSPASSRLLENLILEISKLPAASQGLVALVNVISSRNFLEDLSAFKTLLGISDLTTLEIRDDTSLASQLYDILQFVQYPRPSDSSSHWEIIVMMLLVLVMTGSYLYLQNLLQKLARSDNRCSDLQKFNDSLSASHERLLRQNTDFEITCSSLVTSNTELRHINKSLETSLDEEKIKRQSDFNHFNRQISALQASFADERRNHESVVKKLYDQISVLKKQREPTKKHSKPSI